MTGDLFFAIQGGGDATVANIYVSGSAGLITNGPSIWTPAGALRMEGLHTRYAAINLRGFRRWEGRDCSVLGGYVNCFDVAWRGRLIGCEGMGAGSGGGSTGDDFNAHTIAKWEHYFCYGHDGWDDGWSSHENCEEYGNGSIAEYNAGNGFIPAFGAQAIGQSLISRKNAASPFRPGWKLGGFAAYEDPISTDPGLYTSYELYDCHSIGDKIGFYDSSVGAGAQAFMKAVRCSARDATSYGYQCTEAIDCSYGGTGTAKAPSGVSVVTNAALT